MANKRTFVHCIFRKVPNEKEAAMLFVTKSPCDECVPLIRGAGITHIYTTDLDRDKEKEDISYLMFSRLRNISKFIVSRSYLNVLRNFETGILNQRYR